MRVNRNNEDGVPDSEAPEIFAIGGQEVMAEIHPRQHEREKQKMIVFHKRQCKKASARSTFRFLATSWVAILVLMGCSSTPGINTPIQIGNMQLRVASVQELEQLGDLRAEAGFRLVDVDVDVNGGSIEEAEQLDVTLAGTQPISTNTIISDQGERRFSGWIFSVPTDASPLLLVFSDGTSIDVTSLLRNS